MTAEALRLRGRVLVVEDEESLRVTLSAFLADEGLEATVASDYETAAAALEGPEFDLVFCDIILPGRSGIDVLVRVRDKDPGCPVVMLTGEPTFETATQAVRLGAFDYLAKPVRRDALIRVARQALTHRAVVLENRRLEQENLAYRQRLEERVEEQTRELRAIAEITRIISSKLDINQVYERFASEVRKLIPFDWIVVNAVDLEQGTATQAFSSAPETMGRRRGEPWPLAGTQTRTVVETRSGLVVSDESPDAIVRRFPGLKRTVNAGVRSSLMVPMVSEGSVVGVLNLTSKKPNAYSESDLELVSRIANQIAGAVANARLHAALEAEAEQRRLSESRYRGFVEALPDMLFRVAADSTILDFSPGRSVAPLAAPESFLGRRMEDFLPPDVSRLLSEGVALAVERREAVEREYRLAVDGEERDYEARLVAIDGDEVVAVVRDITEARRSQAELERLATTDTLTGLLNRAQLRVALDGAVRSAARKGETGALIFLDLDGLKLVNDTHGHDTGDRLLEAVGEALRGGIRATDFAARTGGDEFMVVLPDADSQTALERANQLAHRVSSVRIPVAGESIGVTCSAGVAMFPAAGATTEDLVVFADVAMYRAKEAGGNRAVLYDPAAGGREALTALQRTRSMIMAALDSNRIRLVRQPIVSVQRRRPVMYEVLVRLEDEDGTIRTPSDFIPQAEMLGLVERIDREVVAGACERWRRYADAGEALPFSVNMSVRSLDEEMVRFICEQADSWRVPRGALMVEVTETAVGRAGAQTETFVRALKGRGFRVAMDDFGSGSTSFSRLRELGFDCVKLDGSLIQDLATEVPGRGFVRAVADVVRATGAEVVAEHVQDEETMEFLAECAVEYAQGFYLGRPEEFPPEPGGRKARGLLTPSPGCPARLV